MEGGRENATSHSCHGAPQSPWAPVDWPPASRSAEPGGQYAAASWLSVHLGRSGEGRVSAELREKGEQGGNIQPKGKGRWRQGQNQFPGGQPDRPRASRGPSLRQAHCSLEGNPRCCPLVHTVCQYPPLSVRSLRFSASSSSSSSLLFLSSASCFFSRLIWNCGVCRMSPMGEAGEAERKLRKEIAQMSWSSSGVRSEVTSNRQEWGSRALWM